MNVDFIRFPATDNVQLQGWLTNPDGDTAVIHIHGMSGNGYQNAFLDNLRELYTQRGIPFFAIDTRGLGIISSFPQNGQADPWGEGTKLGGSCFEIFAESEHDIQGAIDYLKTRGKTKFILQGHSLGCTKVVNYLVAQQTSTSTVVSVILLAPTDMTGWASSHPEHESLLATSKALQAEGKGLELVGAQCWLDKTPLSAQTYAGICEAGSNADIYGERGGGALLGKVAQSMLILYGDKDIGIEKIDGSIDKWQARVDAIKNDQTRIKIIPGAAHGFMFHEAEVADAVAQFLEASENAEVNHGS